MKVHPLYGGPHAVMSVQDLTPKTFEECMSVLTVSIGQIERLTLNPEQRDRLDAAARRLAATITEQDQ